jgi:hypothetical protein
MPKAQLIVQLPAFNLASQVNKDSGEFVKRQVAHANHSTESLVKSLRLERWRLHLRRIAAASPETRSESSS